MLLYKVIYISFKCGDVKEASLGLDGKHGLPLRSSRQRGQHVLSAALRSSVELLNAVEGLDRPRAEVVPQGGRVLVQLILRS